MVEAEQPPAASPVSISLIAWSILGAVLGLLLIEVHNSSHYGAKLPVAVCGPRGGCEALMRESGAGFFGIPWAWWGLAWYLAWLSLACELPKAALRAARRQLLSLAAAGLLLDLWLAQLMISSDAGLCRLCAASWLVNLAIFGTLALVRAEGDPLVAANDQANPGARAWLRAALLAAAVLVLAALAGRSEHQAARGLARALIPNLSSCQWRPPPGELRRGDPGALHELVLVMDPQCAHCHESWESLLALREERPERIHITALLYPLDRGCNASKFAQERSGSCELSRALLSSPEQEQQDKILALARSGAASGPESLRLALAPLGIAPDDYGASAPGQEPLLRHMAWAREHGVEQVPTLFVAERRLVGAIPKESLRALIDELIRLDGEARR